MIRVREVKVKINENTKENIKLSVCKKLNIKSDEIKSIKIIKESIDLRKKDAKYVYELLLDVNDEEKLLKNKYVQKENDTLYKFEITGKKKMKERIVVVGMGPSGLFCAYMLALNGYNPIIIDRGEKIEDRVKTVEEFWDTLKLNEESNVQFGEGGAGTFSDGKLNTLVKDKYGRMRKVFEIFVECGANEEILYKNKPHIGTDFLRKVIINMRNKMIDMGAEFRYNSKLTNIKIVDNHVEEIEINNCEILKCDNLVLALGHSARDTFKMLYSKNINMISKPFSVGVRVMHNRKMIDTAQYGEENAKYLSSASYKLTYTSKEKRGVYSFCMCPGGFVVNASSNRGKLVINGMSNHDRMEDNSNSAIVVQVSNKDFGDSIFSGMEFQEKLEEKAYKLCNGKIPIQLFSDYENNVISKEFKSVKPVIKGPYEFSNLNVIFPEFINRNLKEAINFFGTKIKGFNNSDTLLAGVETRTSSPIRIVRNDYFMSNIDGIYPIGEGAGYSGGITTSAMDGIRAFEAIAKIYKA